MSTGPLEEIGTLLEALAERVAAVQAAGEALSRRLTTLEAHPSVAATVRDPGPWARTATAEDLVRLYDWVDWLVSAYAVPTMILPGCWPGHPGVVEDLAGLHSAWINARTLAVEGPDDQVAYWHERSLTSLLERLRTAPYGLGECKREHRPKTEEPRTTRPATAPASAEEEDGHGRASTGRSGLQGAP